MATDKIRSLLARIFLSKVSVRTLAPAKIAAAILSLRRNSPVVTFPLLTPPEVLPISPGERKHGVVVHRGNKKFGKISVQGGTGTMLSGRNPGVHGHLLGRKRLSPPGRIVLLKVVLRKNRERAAALPQERISRLSQLKNRPAGLKGDEIPLALYYPVLKENLEKSILNRESGTLLLWYNSSVRVSSSRALVLLRRLGREGGLEWRWISPD